MTGADSISVCRRVRQTRKLTRILIWHTMSLSPHQLSYLASQLLRVSLPSLQSSLSLCMSTAPCVLSCASQKHPS